MFKLFESLLPAGTQGITLQVFAVCLASALVLGAVIALCYTYRATYTGSFVIALALLPAITCVVIMMVSGSLGAGVAVAGTFSLVRFRSNPGTAKEICAVFLAMAVGLACGMGCPGFGAVCAIALCLMNLLYERIGFGEKKQRDLRRTLQITIPEELNFHGAFDDLFATYTSQANLVRVRTTNLGSLNKLTYDLVFLAEGMEKDFIDDLRCRNGNLEISIFAQETPANAL